MIKTRFYYYAGNHQLELLTSVPFRFNKKDCVTIQDEDDWIVEVESERYNIASAEYEVYLIELNPRLVLAAYEQDTMKQLLKAGWVTA